MHVATHLLIGWAVAERVAKTPRDRALIAWASVVPDLDGFGLVVDLATINLTASGTDFYDRFHHVLLHGLPGALACAALFAWFARDRVNTGLWVLVSYHLHLLGDLLGSRGGGETAIWSLHYLSPVSDAMTVAWSGQWPLTSWQNTTITILLMTYALFVAVRRGHSPVGLFSARADAVFVETLRARWSALRHD